MNGARRAEIAQRCSTLLAEVRAIVAGDPCLFAGGAHLAAALENLRACALSATVSPAQLEEATELLDECAAWIEPMQRDTLN